MTEKTEQKEQRGSLQKTISLREDGYYSNCIMVESTPFDISILFGKLRPRPDEKGQPILVELYEKQIYLSHLQARALYESLGRSLNALGSQPSRKVTLSAKESSTQTQ